MARGKFTSVRRGGGRSFSRNLALDENGIAVAVERKTVEEESEDEEGGGEEAEVKVEEEEEEESEEEESPGAAQPELSRAERRELKKQAKAPKKDADEDGDGDDPLLANPNRTMGQMKISDLGAPREPTRREREAKEKAAAKGRYLKLQAEGKTDQAKVDLARLTKIRAEREAAQAKRKAEQDAKAAEIAKKVAAGGKR